jgi:hypothetical protein
MVVIKYRSVPQVSSQLQETTFDGPGGRQFLSTTMTHHYTLTYDIGAIREHTLIVGLADRLRNPKHLLAICLLGIFFACIAAVVYFYIVRVFLGDEPVGTGHLIVGLCFSALVGIPLGYWTELRFNDVTDLMYAHACSERGISNIVCVREENWAAFKGRLRSPGEPKGLFSSISE